MEEPYLPPKPSVAKKLMIPLVGGAAVTAVLFICGFAILALFLGMFILSGAPISRQLVATAVSPDGKVEAKLIEINGGATTSFGYQVLLHAIDDKSSNGKQVASLYGACRNSQAYGVNLNWQNTSKLEVQYYTAKSATLDISKIRMADHHIEIALVPDVIDDTAPTGGMLYNLQGRPYDQNP